MTISEVLFEGVDGIPFDTVMYQRAFCSRATFILVIKMYWEYQIPLIKALHEIWAIFHHQIGDKVVSKSMQTGFTIQDMHGYVEFISCIYYNTSTMYYIDRPSRYHVTVMSQAHPDLAAIKLDDVIVVLLPQVFYYIFIILIPRISSFVVVYYLHEKML